jgi:hypothetical protein
MTKDYHCCATCKHIRIEKKPGQPANVYCQRLGYETKTHYQFHCWDPRPDIRAKIENQEQ